MELAKPYASFLTTTSDLLGVLAECNRVSDSHLYRLIDDLAREAAVIQLQDRWGHFCRELVLTSAVGGIRTTGGTLIGRNHQGRATSLSALRASFVGRQRKPAHWEPKWFDPIEAIDAARRLSVSNLATISAALGVSPSPLEELRAIRNFFAHRGELAGKNAHATIGLVNTREMHDYLNGRLLGGAYRYELWITTLQSMAKMAVS